MLGGCVLGDAVRGAVGVSQAAGGVKISSGWASVFNTLVFRGSSAESPGLSPSKMA